MKNFYLSILLALVIFPAFAQDYIVSSNSVVTPLPLDTYTTAEIDFEHNTTGDLTLNWNLIEKVVPAGWDFSYCDYNTCYTNASTHGTMAPFNTGEHGFLKVNISATSAGWAHFVFEVFNIDNTSERDTVEFWFNGVASIKAMNLNETVIYPNPTNQGENTTIKNVPANSIIEVFNSLGQRINRFTGLNQNSLTFGDELNKGVYLVRITLEGKTETRKLIIR